MEKEPSKKKQRTDTKKDVKRMKRDDFIGSNREKSNIAIAPYTYFSYFGGSNNIFAGCKKTGYYNWQVRTLVPLD